MVAHEEFSKAFCSKLFAGEYGRLFLNVLVKFSPLCSNEIMAREHSYVVREKKKKTTYDFTDFLCNYLQETILFRLQPALTILPTKSLLLSAAQYQSKSEINIDLRKLDTGKVGEKQASDSLGSNTAN